MQKEIDRLINSYRNNALSREEAGMLAGWLEESDENRAYFRECLALSLIHISEPTRP